MKLLIVRHGQTEQNKQRIWQGHSEGMLSEEGREQARKLSERLVKENIDVVYCSDLKRTRDTLKPLLEKKKIRNYYLKSLRERNLGGLEGLTRDNIDEYLAKNKTDFKTSNFETGEYHHDFNKRITSVYKRVAKKHKSDTVLFVTHGGVIAQLISNIFKKDCSDQEFLNLVPKNTGITVIEVKKGKPKMLKFNDTSHL